MIRKHYGTTTDGQAVEQFTLTSTGGATVELINYGATIVRMLVPDAAGKIGDVALGFDNLAGYQSTDNPYFGASVGRVANRIASGTYSVDGKQYHCAKNNGPNSLHGGLVGYDKRVWAAAQVPATDGQAARFSLTDPDGTEGFPGTVNAAITYTLTNNNTLRIEYTATTDKTTPINLTNHCYWNLKDAGATRINEHIVKLYADHYTPVNAELIPTGEIASVKGTPIDFTSAKPIGKDLQAMGGTPAGYDHNLVLNSTNGSLAKAAQIYDPATGRTLEIWTTERGMQFYTSNFLAGAFKGKTGIAYQQYAAFCFETQSFPDAVNQPNFPSCLLRPGQTYHQITEHRFSTATAQPF
jgi:aldose 1-epimerase